MRISLNRGGRRGCFGGALILTVLPMLFTAFTAWKFSRTLKQGTPEVVDTISWIQKIPFIERVPGVSDALKQVQELIPEMRGVPGDPRRFDPVSSLGTARTFAGKGSQLVEMNVQFVGADGTQDLTAEYSPGPGTEYKFVREVGRPKDAPPPGAGGGDGKGPWYEVIEVRVARPGQRVSRTVNASRASFASKGMMRFPEKPTTDKTASIPDPTCSIASFWEIAKKAREIPADAVAQLKYDDDGYRFTVKGFKVDLRFDTSCKPRR